MRILFVLEHFHPYTGGAEELFRKLTVALVQAGHQVTVATTRYDQTLPREDHYQGVRIIRISSGNRYLFTFFSLPVVMRLARNADLIHTTSYNAAFPASIAAFLRRKKVVITFHEVWGKLWFRLPFTSRPVVTAYFLFEQLVLRMPFDRFIAVSKATEQRLIESGVPAEKIEQIYNGLDYDEFQDLKHDPPAQFTFCYFGRLGISKGMDIALYAFRKLLDERNDVKLRFIIPTYPEPLFSQVRSIIRKLELGDSIDLLHNLPRAELMEQVRRSSCVVISSHSEGFCFAAAETVAMGIPIISSGKAALKETVSGLFVELDSLDVDGMLDGMKSALNGNWQSRPIREFPLDQSVQHYLRFYRDLLE